MAYAALVSLQQTTDFILNHHKYSISFDEREQITSIREYVIFLISFLENFPDSTYRLEGKLTDLAYEAEDLIEYFMRNQFRMDWWRVGLSTVKFESRLKRVREEIGSIAGDMMDDRLCDLPATISSSQVAAAMAKNDSVIGLDGDLIAIKGRLCGESSKLEVIPIVGMGGIGKTTIARNAYDDPLIIECFHIRAFVQISQDYTAKEFLSSLLASLNLFDEHMLGEKNKSGIVENVHSESGIAENMHNVSGIAENMYSESGSTKDVYPESGIAEVVYKRLKGRRYLIVMDDIWSRNAWNDFRFIFPDDRNGSRIMLTTRLSDVASYASSGSLLHEMKFMDENQSWNLLQQKVFTNSQVCPLELEKVGKEIAQSCGGLPLAVVLLGGILSTVVKTQASWEEIAKNVNSVIDGEIEKVLSLSYTHLPHHLRLCFLYMGGFPEDHTIRVSRLIKLWVAEGFLRHDEHRCRSLEEKAEEYLEDLVKRNLVLVSSERKSNGKIKACSLHDLVRDLCIRKAKEEKFLQSDLSERRKDEQRISICHSRLNEIWSPTIHTILCFTTTLDSSSLDFLVSFRLLRVLEVVQDNYVVLSPQVFELFHLRYLALAFTDEIPAAISKLENLQTLIIRSRNRFLHSSFQSYLPLEIFRMPRLTHLVFARLIMFPDPADGSILPLENLLTLSGVASFLGTNRVLKLIPNLKKLGIIYCTKPEHHDLQNLVNLHQLETLKITACQSFRWHRQYPGFPRTLKKLTLIGGRFPWKDMTILGSLSNLQVLKLKNGACDGDTWETTDGEFSQLKFLLITQSNLRYWISANSHFPRLNCLVLHSCQYLREIPDSFGEIPTLELIELCSVRQSLLYSVKQTQEDQESYGNDVFKVRHNQRRFW